MSDTSADTSAAFEFLDFPSCPSTAVDRRLHYIDTQVTIYIHDGSQTRHFHLPWAAFAYFCHNFLDIFEKNYRDGALHFEMESRVFCALHLFLWNKWTRPTMPEPRRYEIALSMPPSWFYGPPIVWLVDCEPEPADPISDALDYVLVAQDWGCFNMLDHWLTCMAHIILGRKRFPCHLIDRYWYASSECWPLRGFIIQFFTNFVKFDQVVRHPKVPLALQFAVRKLHMYQLSNSQNLSKQGTAGIPLTLCMHHTHTENPTNVNFKRNSKFEEFLSRTPQYPSPLPFMPPEPRPLPNEDDWELVRRFADDPRWEHKPIESKVQIGGQRFRPIAPADSGMDVSRARADSGMAVDESRAPADSGMDVDESRAPSDSATVVDESRGPVQEDKAG